MIAAAHHDDGWYAMDAGPTYNEEERRPAALLEVPLTTTVPNYGPGVDSVYERDPYAGILASMHWTGLYSARWGVQDGARAGPPDGGRRGGGAGAALAGRGARAVGFQGAAQHL